MKKQNWYWIVGAIAIIVVIIVLFRSCPGSGDTVVLNKPAVKGKTPVATPKQEPIIIVKDSIVFKYLPNNDPYWKEEAKRIGTEYDKMLEAYHNSNDSLQQLLYKSAITPSEFMTEWDNEKLYAKVYGTQSGQIHDMQLEWTIKPTSDTIKVPQTVFRLYGGGQLGLNKDLNAFTYKIDLTGQDKKGKLYTGSYQRILDNDFFLFGFQTSIFQIKK